MRFRHGASPAFTLIELLIVVAIIAILAAIAVPNFLEAQTRSKVSRAKADLRTVATALESYAVDNNRYPYAYFTGQGTWLLPTGFPVGSPDRVGGLTTPIAYITSIPPDPFSHAVNDQYGNPTTAALYYERAGFAYVDGVKTNVRPSPVPSDAVGTGNLFGTGPDQGVTDPDAQPLPYVLFSWGPDLVAATPGQPASRWNLNNRYDPTNGTVSNGNILRLPGGANFP